METRTVLFVDDEESTLNSLKRILNSEPYRTIYAASAHEALCFMKKEKVHVVVSDLRMPQMDGCAFLEEAKKNYPDAVRMMLSMAAEADTILKIIGSGLIYRYIIKPWDNEKIKDIIRHGIILYDLLEEKRNIDRRIDEHNDLIKKG